MRLASEISRCKCPRCVAARRMRFVGLIAICVVFACSAYLALDLPHPMPLGFGNIALTPKTLPHSTPSSIATGAQPSQPSVTAQQMEVIAQSVPESAVSASPTSESWSTSRDRRSFSSSATDSPPGLRVEATPIWAPVATGISPDWAGNMAAETLSKSEVSAERGTRLAAPSKEDPPDSSESKVSMAAAEQVPGLTNLTTSENPGNVPSDQAQHAPATTDPTAELPSIAESPSIVMLQPSDLPIPEPSVAKPPTPSANSEPSTRENAGPKQNADHGEVAATPSHKSNEPSVIPAVATAEPDRLPRSQRQAGLVGKISLTQPQGKVRKAREIALDRSSANLYVSRPTPPPSPSPVEQKTESVASAPPPPVDAPSKSSNRDSSGETDVGGDLRRFAASYVREQEKEDVAGQERYYAGSVHFYGEGDLSWTRIAAATRRYHRDSGQRRYNVLPANVRGPVDGGFWFVDQPYTWSKSEGTHVQTGKSVLRMRVIPSGRGRFKITSIEQVGG
jgi:hypothetical protein